MAGHVVNGFTQQPGAERCRPHVSHIAQNDDVFAECHDFSAAQGPSKLPQPANDVQGALGLLDNQKHTALPHPPAVVLEGQLTQHRGPSMLWKSVCVRSETPSWSVAAAVGCVVRVPVFPGLDLPLAAIHSVSSRVRVFRDVH